MRRLLLLAIAVLCMACGEEAADNADGNNTPVDIGDNDTTAPPDTVTPPGDTTTADDATLAPGCCNGDVDCAQDAFCLGAGDSPGVCAAVLKDGDCFEDSDCGEGGPCDGASICPCGVVCVQGTEAGTCKGGTPPDDTCCSADADCEDDGVCAVTDGGDDGECVEGFTSDKACYNSSHCDADAGEQCKDAIICPCGMDCFAPSSPGTCVTDTGPGPGDVGACCDIVTDQYPDCKVGLICLEPAEGGAGACAEAPPEGGCYDDTDCLEGTCAGGAICGCEMNCVSMLGNCEAGPGPNCCVKDTDCNPNEHCTDTSTGGVCKPLPPATQCWDDSQCDGTVGSCEGVVLCPCGAVCAKPDTTGTCASTETPPGCCATGADCGGGEICVETIISGVCKAQPKAGECWSDLDCIGTASCDGAIVCPCGAACFVPDKIGTCTDGPGPGPGKCCASDADCPGGSCAVADGSTNGECVQKLKFGQCYNDSVCDGGPCNGAILCGCDVTCVMGNTPGSCGPPTPILPGCCDTDADCDGAQICVTTGKTLPGLPPTPFGEKGVCVDPAPLGTCWSDSECDNGQICSGLALCECGGFCDPANNMPGACMDAGPGGPGAGCCTQDSECVAGEQCVLFGGSAAVPMPGSIGVCKPIAGMGLCWTDNDCNGPVETCTGAIICPCGSFCFMPDQMGTCGPEGNGGGSKECCATDLDCAGGACAVAQGQSNGVCQPPLLPMMQCYNDDDCMGGKCTGAILCPCQAMCTKPITPGTCSPPGFP